MTTMHDLNAAVEEAGEVPCQSHPDLWFNQKSTVETRQAMRACMPCPVRDICASYALDNDERFGVWGGMASADNFSLTDRPLRMTGPDGRLAPEPLSSSYLSLDAGRLPPSGGLALEADSEPSYKNRLHR